MANVKQLRAQNEKMEKALSDLCEIQIDLHGVSFLHHLDLVSDDVGSDTDHIAARWAIDNYMRQLVDRMVDRVDQVF